MAAAAIRWTPGTLVMVCVGIIVSSIGGSWFWIAKYTDNETNSLAVIFVAAGIFLVTVAAFTAPRDPAQ